MNESYYTSLFEQKDVENPKFWSRFGGMPDVQGKSVLDVGCSIGALCTDLALAGAARVTGLDINPEYVTFGNTFIADGYPEIVDRVTLIDRELSEYDDGPQFDIIVSKNSFEHILDPDTMLEAMKRRLNPGGRIFIGFGPLYNSMNGSHMERLMLPWGHLFLPERLFLKLCAWDRRHPIASMDDFHLNRRSYRYFHDMFHSAGLEVEYFETNVSTHPVVRIMKVLSTFPPFRELCTISIYCVLKHP
jgi:SAM-dependent methyltransferase